MVQLSEQEWINILERKFVCAMWKCCWYGWCGKYRECGVGQMAWLVMENIFATENAIVVVFGFA